MNALPAIERAEFLMALSRHIEETRGEQSTLGLLLIDISNLSKINHNHSYAHGDAALQYCFNQLHSISRLPETVFRIGDHHFVFILPVLQNPSFVVLAVNKVNKVLEGEVSVNGSSVELDINVGVALNKAASFNPAETLLVAEGSLKQTKQNKGAFVIPKSDKATEKSFIYERYFEEKLMANDFELYYQPKIDLQTGIVSSAEALLRWQIPDEGFLSPEIAVEIAEKTGQSFALTKWVVYTAIRQLKAWEKQGLLLAVAVNIPANLIQSPDLFTMIKDSLAIWGVDKSQLTLEITESAIIDDKEAGFDNLSKLKEFGVKLSIDDFGTGYSSLSYFKHIPANELKIDKSFILNMLANREDKEIVKIITDIAQLFGLKLVAEGIEDQQTYDYLKALGVHFGQGYHMARPMPADQLFQYIQPSATE